MLSKKIFEIVVFSSAQCPEDDPKGLIERLALRDKEFTEAICHSYQDGGIEGTHSLVPQIFQGPKYQLSVMSARIRSAGLGATSLSLLGIGSDSPHYLVS